MTSFELDQEGLNGLDELQNRDNSEDISISPGALDKSDNANSPHRGRGQTARNWTEKTDVLPDENGFHEDGDGQQVLQNESVVGNSGIESELNRALDFDTNAGYGNSFTSNATLPGVQSAALEMFERDIVTVETPEMDKTGVSGSITVNINEERMANYLDEVKDEFGDSDFNEYASAAIGVALETVTEAVTEGYEGEMSISYDTPTEQVPENFDTRDIDEDHWKDEDDVDKELLGASFVREIAEDAISTYEQNLDSYDEQQSEYQDDTETVQEEVDQEDSGGFFGGDGLL